MFSSGKFENFEVKKLIFFYKMWSEIKNTFPKVEKKSLFDVKLLPFNLRRAESDDKKRAIILLSRYFF